MNEWSMNEWSINVNEWMNYQRMNDSLPLIPVHIMNEWMYLWMNIVNKGMNANEWLNVNEWMNDRWM